MESVSPHPNVTYASDIILFKLCDDPSEENLVVNVSEIPLQIYLPKDGNLPSILPRYDKVSTGTYAVQGPIQFNDSIFSAHNTDVIMSLVVILV